jgi:hypothetical protein
MTLRPSLQTRDGARWLDPLETGSALPSGPSCTEAPAYD